MVCLENVILAFVALSGAIKAAHLMPRSRFSVDVVSKAALLKKRNWNISVALLSVELDNYFVTPFQVGLTSLYLEVSLRNAELWVISRALVENDPSLPIAYFPSPSARQLSNYNWSLSHHDVSNVSGNQVYLDTVGLGPETLFAYPNQSVLIADSASPPLPQNRPNFDGAVGLTYDKTSGVFPNPQPSFFENIAGSLEQPIIGMALKYKQQGSLDFGYINSQCYNGTLEYQNINTTNGLWQVRASNSGDLDWDTYLDSGSSVITLPAGPAGQYYTATSQVVQADPAKWPDLAGKAIFPCNLTLPSVTFRINNYTATIPGKYLNVKTLTHGYCYCGIQQAQGSSMPVLGAPFLMSQYAVFDLNGPRVGLSPQV